MSTIEIQGDFPPERIDEAIRHIQNAIAGREPDRFGIAEKYWSAIAHSLFSSIFKAYQIKSLGGQDELGESWQDLSLNTKAYGRKDARQGLTLFDNRAKRHPNLHVRPTLDPVANRHWGGMWLGTYLYWSLNKARGPHKFDKRLAGNITWAYFKSKGFSTLKDLTRSASIPILKDTGALERSFFPAPLIADFYVVSDPNQVYHHESGKLTIGTSLAYANEVDQVRPLWPRNMNLWLDRAAEAGANAIHINFPIILTRT